MALTLRPDYANGPPASWSRLIRVFAALLCSGGFGSVQGEVWGAQPGIEFTVIDRELGLVDVVVRSAGHPGGLAVEYRDPEGQSRHVTLDRRPDLDGDGGSAHAARVRLATRGGDAALVSLIGGEDGASRREHRIDLGRRAPTPRTPAWAKGRVWYQVFPERFANGDPSNDPDEFGATTLEWDAPWYEPTLTEIEAARNRVASEPELYRSRPSSDGGAFDAVVFQRRYGGDLQGVIDRLDHIRSLGVDGLYLCPVFASRSLHKYDARDHRHVDPAFGPSLGGAEDVTFVAPEAPADERTWGWTPADRLLIDGLMPEARRRGMRVMLDGVWNHVGLDHWAFRDVLENGRASRFADWFDVRFDAEGRVAGWMAWDGENGSLPEFRQIDGDIAPGPKAHLFAVTRRWMDPNGDGDPSDGIDGWRLDVAAEVGRVFWRDWRALVKSINPDALIVAEIWFDADDYFDGTAFDAQMHYPFAFAGTSWLGRTPGFETRDLTTALAAVTGRRPGVDLVQMTLLASHDTERLASMLQNPRGVGYDQGASWGDVWRGAYISEPERGALERSVLGAALQAVWPGAPMIYGGDEWGLPGADDPSNRIPIQWADLVESNGAERRVRDGYAAWFGARRDPVAGPVLRLGSVRVIEHPDRRVLVVSRRLDGVRVVAILNSGDGPVPIDGLMDRFGVRRALIGSPGLGQVGARSGVAWISGM